MRKLPVWSAMLLLGMAALAVPERGTGSLRAQGVDVRSTAPQVLPGLDPDRPLTQYSREVWSEREGLPQNFVETLAQTPDGYLWIGTSRGLVRFDGLRFTVFGAEETPGLPISWVRALWADADGTLWIGTGGEGLVRLRDGVFTSLGAAEGLTHGMITSLLRDREGRLWVGTDGGGLLRYADGRFHPVGTGSGLEDASVLSLAEDGSGALWVGTGDGLRRGATSGEMPRFEEAGADVGLAGARVLALAADPEGGVWVGTSGAGLYRGDDTFRRADPEGGLSGALVSRLLVDRQGTLWVGTNGDGLFRLREGRLDGLTTADGFPSNLVWDLLEDREGNLWVGTNVAGLVRLRDGFFETFGAPEGLSMDVALAVLEDREGALWVGTPGEGVNRMRDGVVTTYTTEDGLGSDIVLSLAEDPEGAIWVGMAAGGLSRIQAGVVTTFSSADGLEGHQVTVVHTDREGVLWLGVTGYGVQRWTPDGAESYRVADGIPAGGITTMADGPAGDLWVGTREGLAFIARARGSDGPPGDRITVFGREEGLPHATINQLHLDEDGALWVATMGGLARIHDGEITSFGTGIGIPEDETMAVMVDGHGFLWITSSQGIARVARDELLAAARDPGTAPLPAVKHFGRADGLRSAEANGGIHPAIWRAADGGIWVPTMAGAVRIDPERTERTTLAPRPVLERILAGDRTLPIQGPIRLAPDERWLEFQFSAPALVAPEEVEFRYRLEGFDEEWVETRERRSAIYTNLPPGDLRFLVEARGRTGEWTSLAEPLRLRLEPRFAERRAVQFGGLLLLLLLAWGGYVLRIRRMKERQRELLHLMEERERTQGALRRSEERLRLALEAGRMGTWEWHPESGEVVWSRGMEELFEFSPRTLEEFLDRLHARVDPEDADRVRHTLARVLAEEVEDFHLDFGLRLGESSGAFADRQVELRGRWAREAGGVRRIVGVASDVTTLIETRRALRMREEELRKSQKLEAVGQLAGGVAHDFNNLLAVIGANSRLALHDLSEDHPAREEILEIVRAGDRATKLTQQLLAFGRKQVLQPRSLDLNDVIRSVERMLSRLIRENIELRTVLDPKLREVLADEGGVEQILVNLVLNAQDAMPEGGMVTISTENIPGVSWEEVRWRPEDTEESLVEGTPPPLRGMPHVLLTVADTGHGMDDATRERIFEPFFSTKEPGKGTGMGLASVYGLVQQSGGEIETRSAVGEGTEFRIRFPLPRIPARTGGGATAPSR